jgi:hypothetical protein
MVRPPDPPAPGPKPAKLTTEEEKLGGVNAGFAAFLSGICAKGSPKRFNEPVREKLERDDDHRFTEKDLDRFFLSLSPVLMPSALAEDPGPKRIWLRFWDARTRSAAAFIRHYAEEMKRNHRRVLDADRDAAELVALERSIVRGLIREDRKHLRVFVGRQGVTQMDLTIALWTSHADGWYDLAHAKSPIAAVRLVLGGHADEVERTRSSGFRTETVPAVRHNASSGDAMKPYQALVATRRR